ncbi:MAG: FKBP-type peptidyl-prolyl cis-trans isomerase [Salinivirgaceae bacterium]|nr:FKBP-type peptidyl-prolyl cis-trans isomerase [Salinivirgaceae bacterium]MDD4746796.1 FKBP-type peptidyl-prolyl cis-trans isomerase [Salinivirgaceae bacterium]MDY0282689.1 FKBP-type peptidyl-prolyl cis-trans isomerase [Salinivirgaceae bacterium]
MKFSKIFYLGLSVVLFASCQNNQEFPTTTPLATKADSVSYTIGMQQGANLLGGIKQMKLEGELNYEAITQGFLNALKENPTQVEEAIGNMLVQTYLQEKMMEQQAQQPQQEMTNPEEDGKVKAEGEAFLAENAKRKGITVTPSGLQYEILKNGNGPKPQANNTVKVHYHGTLIDGTIFDSSVDRGEPAEFGVTQVIPGWVEALQLMPVGSKWKLYIPQELAYGGRNSGGPIKPFSTLIFEVELIAISK